MKKAPLNEGPLADWTGLEPATSAVTGRHSNQLNYQSLGIFQDGKDRGFCFSANKIVRKITFPYLYANLSRKRVQ